LVVSIAWELATLANQAVALAHLATLTQCGWELVMKLRTDLLPLLSETWNEFLNDEAGQRGAALAYYAVFSLFPLLILSLAVLGFVLRHVPAAGDSQQEVLRLVARQVSPQFSRNLREMLKLLQEGAPSATGVGLFILWFSASSVFQQLDHTFHKIWRVPEKPLPTSWTPYLLSIVREQLTSRLFAFLLVLIAGVLFLFSLSLSIMTEPLLRALTTLPWVGGLAAYLAGWVTALALNTLIFALLFKYLPETRVEWRDVLLGAVLTALAWEFAKRLLAFYVATSNFASAYGVVGTLLVIMLWIYFSSQVLFLGAEFTEVYSRRHGSRLGQHKGPELKPETSG
jgi:membrane protein